MSKQLNILVRDASIVERLPGGIFPAGLFLMIESCLGGVWCTRLVRLDAEPEKEITPRGEA